MSIGASLDNFWQRTKTRLHAIALGAIGAVELVQQLLPTVKESIPPAAYAGGVLLLAVTLYVVGHRNQQNLKAISAEKGP